MLKPVLEISEVAAFLGEWASSPVADLELMPTGQIASVYSFDVGSDDSHGSASGMRQSDIGSSKYVARFVSPEYAEGLKKDRFIALRAAKVGVPVPRIVELGETAMRVVNRSPEEELARDGSASHLAFAICERAPGEHMGELQDVDRRHLLPAAIEAMDSISHIDISDTIGFGWFDGEGKTGFATWVEYLAATAEKTSPGSFYKKHRRLFEDGFLEADVFDYFSQRMMELAGYTPVTERSVVHSDFGWDNTLVEGDRVTSVLDWDNAIIGDHLYDGARTDLYSPDLDLKPLFAERNRSTGREVPNFDERWLCSQLHVSIDALGWYGRSNNPEAYEWMKARTRFLLGEGPAVGRHPSS